MKRVLCLILAVLMVLSFLSACGKSSDNQASTTTASTSESTVAATTAAPADSLLGVAGELPVVKQPFNLTILTNQGEGAQVIPSTDLIAYQEVARLTGVTVIYESAPFDTMAEVITTRLAANSDLPDIINMTVPDNRATAGITMADIFNYGKNGLFQEITPESLATNAPGYAEFIKQNPDAQIMRTSDEGKMYSIPDGVLYRQDWQIGLVLNDAWMKELNLAAPTTTDEFYNVLKSFKDNDPNKNGKKDEVPFINLWDTLDYMADSWDLQSIEGNHSTAYGFMHHADGTVTCDFTDPRMKEYFAYMNKLYKDGLLDKEFGNTTMDTLAVKVKANRVGGMIEWLNFSQIYDTMIDPNYMKGDKAVFPIFQQPKAAPQYTAHRFKRPSTIGNWVITSAAKRPDVALRFLDTVLFNPKMVELLTWGIEGQHFKMENGKHVYIEGIPNFGSLGFGQWSLPNHQDGWDETTGPKLASDIANNRPFVDMEPFPQVTPTTSENDILKKYLSDIKTYFQEARAKFITGDMPISDFDKYVTEIKKRGADDLLVVYQAQYKRALEIQAKIGK